MARLKYIEEEEAKDPRIKEAYQRMIAKRGKVTNIYKIMAYKPEILRTIGPFVAAVQAPDEVDARLKEKIILKASRVNGSVYCSHAHVQIMRKMEMTDEEIAAVDHLDSPLLTEAEKVALEYTEKLSRDANGVSDELFARMQQFYSDSQIVEITCLICLYSMINRFNEAMKLDLEDY
ncbi:putative peroxidase-related enzyme [Desulfofundulus luciae]|uniref:Peroxidase-related enzyme n=1 Tax=Desulfofundulus luciae TaxID=74702 RepID=A0ABU0B5U4_9FIRM|nr:carboxymuconolactone decarboxylase family protein [Desulfofundulus luciae]MDQ0287301.1 putative peroxidase-related enzyme [Desulfofundulus luciae]